MKFISFDPSLANCGWVSVGIYDGEIRPVHSGVIRSTWTDQGLLEPIFQTVGLTQLVGDVLGLVDPELVLVEMPPVRRPNMERESSLLACTAVAMAASEHGLRVVGVSAQKAKRSLTGFANAKKPVVREAFLAKWPMHRASVTNEHTRDAWLLAWEWWTNEQ